ncbi:MMPL family transporter [Gordonia sinesedis]
MRIFAYVRANGSPGALLDRWGRFVAVHRRWVIAIFVVVVAGGAASFPVLESRLSAMDFAISGAESTRAEEIINTQFADSGSEQDLVVFRSDTRTADDPEFRAITDRTLAQLRTVTGVRQIANPFERPDTQISADQRVAVAIVGIDGTMAERATVAADLQKVAARHTTADIEIGATGYSPIQNDAVVTQTADVSRAELIGIPVALAVLLIALGAVVAAVLPVVVALSGMAIATGLMLALSTVTRFDALTVSIATMIGIGVGIDYAMFVVSRFREELAAATAPGGNAPDRNAIAAACGRALATAGANVAASGIIVMISLSSLIVLRAPMFRGIVLGVAVAVTSMLLVGLIALPALLAALGTRVNRGRLPARLFPAELVTAEGHRRGESGWSRWARVVMRRPVRYGTFGIVTLIAAAAPLFAINEGLDMGTSALADMPSGRAAAALDGRFPEGAAAPITVVATGPDGSALSAAARAEVNDYVSRAVSDERIAAILPAEEADGRMVIPIVAAAPFDSADALALVRWLRSEARSVTGADVLVGGSTATFIDLGDEMSNRLPVVIAIVLGVTLMFLVVAFRSIAVPLKAIAMNVLATGAALGITVAVFQWGIGESLLDFESPGFVQVYLPTIVFVVLFGLSMDYEVFLIGRIREYWHATGDNEKSVADGIGHTARPITAAAAIMVVVFASFITAATLELKQVGFALAVAVAIDAIIVRMILVPAFLKLLGRWNWWLPMRPQPAPRTPLAGTPSATS